ncbi:hypothetical protein Nepgr_019537 [Nepenthes gracilis]|uniref:Uncharacterized protein n=1 Tax=Nepenthes gracilis TaxID=150966 RepID=A0AAD3SVH5_NEPGR|nr:hypothetical protein Nepgr_019537 [Nepenthes gracilis]
MPVRGLTSTKTPDTKSQSSRFRPYAFRRRVQAVNLQVLLPSGKELPNPSKSIVPIGTFIRSIELFSDHFKISLQPSKTGARAWVPILMIICDNLVRMANLGLAI